MAHLLFWLAGYVLMVSRFDPFVESEDPLMEEMINGLFYISFSMILAYFLAYRILPGLVKAKNYLAVIVEMIVGSYIISAFARIMVVHVLEPIVRTPPFEQEPIGEILTDIPKLFYAYFIHTASLSLVFIFIKLIKDQYVINKRALELEKQRAETELKSLKDQLNPHFLFNTLNNIYSLSLVNAPQTSSSIARLSEILDHLLYRCGGRYVPLLQEITLLQNYIELEKLRYDDRLQVHFSYSLDRDGSIAPLILLSLVENAFKHGAGEDAGTPRIEIELNLAGKHFNFTVKNSFRQQQAKEDSLRIGLTNIRKQLDLVYPGSHTFVTGIQGNEFTASLQIELPEQEKINLPL